MKLIKQNKKSKLDSKEVLEKQEKGKPFSWLDQEEIFTLLLILSYPNWRKLGFFFSWFNYHTFWSFEDFMLIAIWMDLFTPRIL